MLTVLRIRLLIISVFFCVLFACAIARLADLQINRTQELASNRDRLLNSIKQRTPRRGRIIDADGQVIAEDQPTQDLYITPARVERVNRRRVVLSNLPPLTADQMTALATARGPNREFERKLAIAALAENNPLVAELSTRLNMKREEVAEKVVGTILASRQGDQVNLIDSYPTIEDIDFALALEIRSARVNPYGEEMWKAAEIHTGGKRVYPAGKVMGHLTGTVGKLTREEYEILRGRWNGEDQIPGKGFIEKQGRTFFSILSGTDLESDEQLLIRLRTSKRDGKVLRTQGYFTNDIVGRGGLEQFYNQSLRGRHRIQHLGLVRDEKSGRRRREPKGDVTTAVNGADIRLSVKLDVQRKTYEILEKHLKQIAKRPELVASKWVPSGVAILMDPNNGRIYSMVSLPSYDPNTFNKDFAKLAGDRALPLLDRSLAGIYPPGSVVKPLVGLAALTEEAVFPGQRFNCDRIMLLAGAKFTCLGRHGDQDLESALMHSCNMYFYHAGEKLGGRRLYEWYTRMGLGHPTGIDIAGEKGGILPKNAYTRRGWATGNTYHMAIGQGVAVTPLQIAVAYAALANAEGNIARIVRPHLLIPSRNPESPEEEALSREALRMDQPVAEIMIDREAMAVVRQGMWEAVQGKPETGEIGTGYLASFPDSGHGYFFELAGKTGTAEWSKVVGGRVIKQISHVWFGAYAPFDRPKVVAVVFLPEAGGGGGTLCAPIAKDLLRMWFNLPDRFDDDMVDSEDALG